MSSSNEASPSSALSAPPWLASESLIRVVPRDEEGMASWSLPPVGSKQVSQMQRDISIESFSSSDDDVWDPTGKTIEELKAYMAKY